VKVFALSDPHLSFATPNKKMDRFGAQWVGHPQKIAARWAEVVADGDIVLVPGDISWAMKLEQARADLAFLGALPGTKVLLKGNHDYWWRSASQVRAALPPRMYAVQADALRLGEVAIAGTRLWDLPGISFHDIIDWRPGAISEERTIADEEESRRIAARELLRLERALAALDQAARGATLRIAITHYPPTDAALAETPATRGFQEHGVQASVFGHLHCLRRDLPRPPFGTRGGVRYSLASVDAIDFRPIEIAQV